MTNATGSEPTQDNYRTKPCRYFLAGTCKNGDRCTWLHGDGQRQGRGQVNRQQGGDAAARSSSAVPPGASGGGKGGGKGSALASIPSKGNGIISAKETAPVTGAHIAHAPIADAHTRDVVLLLEELRKVSPEAAIAAETQLSSRLQPTAGEPGQFAQCALSSEGRIDPEDGCFYCDTGSEAGDGQSAGDAGSAAGLSHALQRLSVRGAASSSTATTAENGHCAAVLALHAYIMEQGGEISATSGVADFYKAAGHDGERFKAELRALGAKNRAVFGRYGLVYEKRAVGSDMIRLSTTREEDKREDKAAPAEAAAGIASQPTMPPPLNLPGPAAKEQAKAEALAAKVATNEQAALQKVVAKEAARQAKELASVQKAAERNLVARTLRQQDDETAARAHEAAQLEHAQRARRAEDLRLAQQQHARAPQQGASPKAEDVNRRFFDKVVKTANFRFKGAGDAERFAEALRTYGDDDLPWRLTRYDEYGLKRMVDAAQTAGIDATMLMVRALMQRQWKDQKFSLALNECARELFAAHSLFERVARAVKQQHIRSASDLRALANFGVVVTFALGPAVLRQHEGRARGGGALCVLAKVLVDSCHDLVVGDPPDPIPSKKALAGARRFHALLTQELATANQMNDVEVRVAAEANRLHATNISQRPGGRHSNDHVDFRQIRVVPTVEELLAEEHPFLPRADRAEDFLAGNPQTQLLDRQFRLLREDMIATVREAHAKGSQFQLPVTLERECLEDHGFWTPGRNARHGEKERVVRYGRGPSGLRFSIDDSTTGKKAGPGGAKLVDLLSRRRLLQVGSLALLRNGDQALAIGRVVRQLREATADNPDSGKQIGIAFDDEGLVRLLKTPYRQRMMCKFFLSGHCKNGDHCTFSHEINNLQLVALPGSFFAYEPVLKCLQTMHELPFREELLLTNVDPQPPRYHGAPDVMQQLNRQLRQRGIELDHAQRAAFEHATSCRLASIVGPPGCGKSFAGSELALAILAATAQKLLVVCYTNHALDQFLCHLLDRNEQRIVRIGGKSREARLDRFSLFSKKKLINDARGAAEKKRIWQLHTQLEEKRQSLCELCSKLRDVDHLTWQQVVELLEIEDPGALKQLRVPRRENGFETADRSGKRIRDDDLWKDWRAGRDPPQPFSDMTQMPLWLLSAAQRRAKQAEWVELISANMKTELIAVRHEFDQIDSALTALDTASERAVLQDERVIAATTTGSAKYRALIESAAPGVLLLEEAGEVLEAHVISSLSASVKHIIMIGDHKQLRPKVEAHSLTVAANNGYNLNRSLFERLILGGMAHAVLETQHRMRPEISSIARYMTYPKLRDHESVKGREDVRGLAANVCFINHSQLEDGEADDGLAFKSPSKVNEFEAEMAVQVTQFLLLQGYRTDSIVVLTPYLGQLKILNQKFRSHRITATIGERDVEDLLNIGVDQPWLQQIDHSVKGVRTCTIDNYQGEEADLIITSLVRSNQKGKLGFLGKADAEQRVNVLCTRARLGMIFIGNVECFLNASPRSRLWTRLLGLLRERGEIFDGLPIKCQKHAEICQPIETNTPVRLRQWCAQGAGCGRKCDTLLDCGHVCPLKCHAWPHDEMIKCEQPVREMCPAGRHCIERACSSQSLPRCEHKVVEQCQNGHPLVRCCADPAVSLRCAMCKALADATAAHERDNAKHAQDRTAMLQKHAKEAAMAVSDDAEETQRMHQRMRLAAEKELTKLIDAHAHTRVKRDRELAEGLDRVTREVQDAVRQATAGLEARRQRDEETLRARRAEHERQLQAAEERMKQQRAEQQRRAEADIEQRDDLMRTLHETLAANLADDEAAIAQVNADRADPTEVQRQLEQVRLEAKQVTCSICADEATILDGPLCSGLNDHFLCKECFDAHVTAEVSKPGFDGHVYCPCRPAVAGGCTSQPYSGAIIARFATQATFEGLTRKREALREREIAEQMQREYDARFEAEKTKWEAAGQAATELKLQNAKKHIVDRILTLSCPRCGQSFVDFDGCFALECSRQGCGCGFCAYCLEDCGADAHAHVSRCALPNGDLYGSMELFERAQRTRRERLVDEYLQESDLDADARQRLIKMCHVEFTDLGLNIN